MGQLLALQINPTGELPAPQNPFAAMEILNKKDGFEVIEIDHQIAAAHVLRWAGTSSSTGTGSSGGDTSRPASGSRTSPSSRATRSLRAARSL
jgi:hypothetical protein